MVSQNVTEVTSTNRGFVAQESVVAGASGPFDAGLPLPSFWGSVIAGAVVVMGIGSLSASLMFGCYVGTYANGMLSFGWGAGLWIIATACIAYYFGGMVASRLSLAGGWLRGLVVWGLSVPLTALIAAFISGASGLAYAHTTRLAEQLTNNTGAATLYSGTLYVNYAAAWVVFFALLCGLIFSLFGASTSCACGSVSNKADETPHVS
jgi:hypothetical protein